MIGTLCAKIMTLTLDIHPPISSKSIAGESSKGKYVPSFIVCYVCDLGGAGMKGC